MNLRTWFLLGSAAAALGAGRAEAHLALAFPQPSTIAGTGQKGAPPCGVTGPRNPQRFRPGETITVRWTETVQHAGHFRVAFDDDGKDFPNPVTRKDTSTLLPIFVDGLDEKTATMGTQDLQHEYRLTFPNRPCSNCTLQVIQIMRVNPPYNPAANRDIYYACADIVLDGAEPDGGGPDAKAADGSGPSDAGDASASDVAGGAGGVGGAAGSGAGGGGTSGAGMGGTRGAGMGGTAVGGAGGGGAVGGAGGENASTSGVGGCAIASRGQAIPSALEVLFAVGLATIGLRARRRFGPKPVPIGLGRAPAAW